MQKRPLEIHRLGISKSTNGCSWQTHLEKFWIKSLYLLDTFSDSEEFFLFSKIKEQCPKDFFCLFKVSETKWWSDAWIILMVLCDWILLQSFKYTKPLSVSLPLVLLRVCVEKEPQAVLGLLPVLLDLSTQPWESRQSIWGLISLCRNECWRMMLQGCCPDSFCKFSLLCSLQPLPLSPICNAVS